MESISLDRRIKIRHLDAFSSIARHGSLKGACATLNLTQPALSKTLKELEGILGVRLMERDRGGIRLTSEGAVFLEFANQSLVALRRGVSGVGALRAGGAETLRVGALPSVSAHLLPRAVTEFRALSPDTRLSLRDGSHDALTSDLRAGALDLVIGRMAEPQTMQGLSFTQLYLEHVVCVARPDHPAFSRPGFTSQMLDDWPVLYPPKSAAIRPLLDRWCLAEGLAPFADRIDCVSGAFGRNFVRDSDALWFISQGVVAQDIADARLRKLPLDMDLTTGPVGLMTLPETVPSRSQQVLTRALATASHSLTPQ